MTLTRRKTKGRLEAGQYFALPHAVMHSPNYVALSVHAVKLLNDLGLQFTGFNNGDLCMAWRIMQPRGWKSRATLDKAKKELLHYGMVELTRQGGMHKCSLYALTWLPIDDCKGKLDVHPTRTPSGTWRPLSPVTPIPDKNTNANTAGVSMRHGRRVNQANQTSEQALLTRQAC